MADEGTTSGARWDWVGILRSRVFVWVGIPLLWAVAYLPGLGARDLMHEEGRRAEPAAEMLRTGDWVTPRLYGEAYLSKPPMFFWMAAGLGKLRGGVDELSVRVPSVISALLGAWLVVGFARKELKREVRVLAGLIFLAMPVMLDKGTLGEIDAVLSLETFASFVVLWAGWDSERGRIRMWAWVVSGICMGIGALTKGPGGAIEFYGVVVPFLFLLGGWRRLRVLISPGHLLMIGVAAVPVVVWVGVMLRQTHAGLGQLVGTWMDQLDFDLIPGMQKSVEAAGVETPAHRVWVHYTEFGGSAVWMLMPWVIWAVAGAMPWFRRRVAAGARGRALWLLLAVSFPALLVLFWAWPGANARYMMMGAYPVSVLAAWVVVEGGGGNWERWWPVMRGAALVMVVLVGLGSVAAAVAASFQVPQEMNLACAMAVAALFSTQELYRVTRSSPPEQSGIAFVAMLAIVGMVGWGLGKSVFNPLKARSDATRRLHEQMDKLLVNHWPVYTTRTLSGGKGNDYFDAQFYLPGGAKGIGSFSELPAGVPVVVILLPEEMGALREVAPGAQELGRLQASNGPSPLVVAGVTR